MIVNPLPYPLHLYDYWVTDYRVTTQKEFKKSEENQGLIAPGDPNLEIDTIAFNRDDDPRHWVCQLNIELKDISQNKYSHTFRVELFGFFRIQKDFAVDQIEHLIQVGAPSLLYSVAREMIASVTIRGPLPAMFLPTVTFYKTPIAPTPAANEDSQLKLEASIPELAIESPPDLTES